MIEPNNVTALGVAFKPLAVGPETAAQMTGMSRSAIYAAIAAGDLLAFKAGKRRLMLVKELETWINQVAAANYR